MEDLTEHSALATRIWLLLLLTELASAGLVPIERLRLHKLLFLSNSLAPVYGSQLPAPGVSRNTDGPFYPRLQWQLDRLIGMSLVSIEDLSLWPTRGNKKQTITYTVTEKGFHIIDQCLILPSIQKLQQFFKELCFSFATIKDETRDAAALHEINYAKPGAANGSFVDLSRRESNLTTDLTDYFAGFVPQQGLTNRREQVRLYIHYLETISAKAS